MSNSISEFMHEVSWSTRCFRFKAYNIREGEETLKQAYWRLVKQHSTVRRYREIAEWMLTGTYKQELVGCKR